MSAMRVIAEWGGMGEQAQRRWYAVYCKPRQEDRAATRLQAQGYEVLFLQHYVELRRGRKTLCALRPHFSRYVFLGVMMPGQSLYPVASTPGVTRVICRADGRPVEIPDVMVSDLKGRADERGVIFPKAEEEITRWRVGQRIQISGGTLNGMWAEIARVDGEHRLLAYLRMFGRQTAVVLTPEQVVRRELAG